MRGIILTLLGLCLACGMTLFSARAHADELSDGHIGIALRHMQNHPRDSDYAFVVYIAEGSPAAVAGVRKGDCISAIDGISTNGMAPVKEKALMKGKIDETVKLTIRRGDFEEDEVSIVRRSIPDAYLSAATAGDFRAQYELGYYYEYGPARDLTQSLGWYRKAAEQGNAVAQVHAGRMYLHGWGTPKDEKEAASWFLKAANQGEAVGERELAYCYRYGLGVDHDDQQAFNWYYSAAQQDDSTAEEYLAFLYDEGRGVARNDREAFNWYYRAAEHGNAYGEWGLAYMYDKGRGVKRDPEAALKWYQKAQVGFPQNDKLKKAIAIASLKAFIENRNASSLDPAVIMAAFREPITVLFLILMLVYAASGVSLFFFGFRNPDLTPGFAVATGWIVFYLESQIVALFAVFLLGKTFTAGTFILVTVLFSAVPVILSTCGSNMRRIWKESELSWQAVLLYAGGAWLIIFTVMVSYSKIYAVISHAPLPLQETHALLGKAKDSSLWLVYAGVALLMPAAEEIMFRGYLFDALRRYCSGTIVVILTAAGFALVHFQWLHFVPLFGFGAVLGWVKLKTNSLRLPVFLHAINNGIALAFVS